MCYYSPTTSSLLTQKGANQLEKECNQLQEGANQLQKKCNQLQERANRF